MSAAGGLAVMLAAEAGVNAEHPGVRLVIAGVAVRVVERLLALAAAIWRNNRTGAPSPGH